MNHKKELQNPSMPVEAHASEVGLLAVCARKGESSVPQLKLSCRSYQVAYRLG